jgi:hypothetical protein
MVEGRKRRRYSENGECKAHRVGPCASSHQPYRSLSTATQPQELESPHSRTWSRGSRKDRCVGGSCFGQHSRPVLVIWRLLIELGSVILAAPGKSTLIRETSLAKKLMTLKCEAAMLLSLLPLIRSCALFVIPNLRIKIELSRFVQIALHLSLSR